jgi:serine/threonine protein kinase
LVLSVAADLAAALQHIHAKGIVHADVTVSNVLLQRLPSRRHGCVAKLAGAQTRREPSRRPGPKRSQSRQPTGDGACVRTPLPASRVPRAPPRRPARLPCAPFADFGLSVKLPAGREQLSNMYGGTPHYMAPERMEGRLSMVSLGWAAAAGQGRFDGQPSIERPWAHS